MQFKVPLTLLSDKLMYVQKNRPIIYQQKSYKVAENIFNILM